LAVARWQKEAAYEQRLAINEQHLKMNITRNNYEEFFLLYVDNELSAAERNAVELFVKGNADLKNELNMLQQTVINADAVVFDKTSLLKKEFTALQENLLLYIDDELSVASKLGIDKLLKADSVAGKELALLQQTKLQPDAAVVFADKKILYRKESAKVVGLPWRRIAAAAILLGFGTWATILFIKTNKNEGEIVAVKTDVNPATAPQVANTITPVQAPQKTTETANVVTPSTENATNQLQQKNIQSANNNQQQNLPHQKVDNSIAVKENNKKPSNNLPKPDYNNFNNNNRNEIDIAFVPPVNTAADKRNSGDKITDAGIKDNPNKEVVNGYALNTNFTEGDAGENNNNKILYMDEDKVKKSKLGGFFRKVKRLVERNTNITTGNGIKVAGFDIAIN